MTEISISQRILSYRQINGLSQGEFGKRIGVSAQAVSKWECEKTYPDITLLPALAKILNCEINDFFSE